MGPFKSPSTHGWTVWSEFKTIKTRGGTYAHIRSAPCAAEAPVICVYMRLEDSSKILHNFQKLTFLVNNLPFEVKLIFFHEIVSYSLLHYRMKMSDFLVKEHKSNV